jgi:F0F1-type ATP synthase assembly protein I
VTEPGRGGRQGAGRAPAGKAKAAQKREEPGSRFIGLAAVVFRVALLVLVFVLLGDWVDRSLNTAPWFMVTGIVLAFLIVIVAAQRSAVKERRRQARRRQR